MKKIKLLIFTIGILILTGCGHSLYHKVQGTGLYGRIPTPNGSSLVQIALGDMNITSGVLRGGATLDQNTSKGGTFGAVSIGRHTHVSTTPAVNEGNIESILTSKHTDEKTKQLIATYLITRKPANPPTASVAAVNAGSATGKKDEIPQVKVSKTGLDNIVDTAGDTIKNIAPVVKDGTVEVSKSFQKTFTETSDNWKVIFKEFKNIIIVAGIIIIVILIISLIIYLIVKRKQI